TPLALITMSRDKPENYQKGVAKFAYVRMLSPLPIFCDVLPAREGSDAFPSMETSRVHHAARRRGGLAARSASAAASDAGGRVSSRGIANSERALSGGISPGLGRSGLRRKQERSNRVSLC